MRLPHLASTLLVAFLLTAGLSSLVAAEPVRRTVGPYELAVSYAHEPPYLEEGNALVIEVRDARTGQPVLGLERTLRVQGSVTVLEVTRTYAVPLRPAVGRPGVYEGVFVPPALGRYTFRLSGTIEQTPLDEWFTSGEGGLPEVVPRTESDYRDPGVLLALAIFIAYLVGLAAILIGGLVRRWLRVQHAGR